MRRQNQRKAKLFLISITMISLVILSSCAEKLSQQQLEEKIINNIEIDNYVSANKELTKLIKIAPESSHTYYLKGLLESKQDKNKQALNSLYKSIDFDSLNYRAYVTRAAIKNKLGDYNGAIKDCNKSKNIKSNYPSSYLIISESYEHLGNIANAIKNLENAIKNGDNQSETFYKLGILQLEAGKKDLACANLSKAGELGCLNAFNVIKENCNSSSSTSVSKFKYYPNRYVINFPDSWIVDEISNSDKSVLNVTANYGGCFISVVEIAPSSFGVSEKFESVKDFEQSTFLKDVRQKQENFKLLSSENITLNGVDTYYYEFSFSKYSQSLSKSLNYYNMLQVSVHPQSGKLYYLSAAADKEDFENNKQIFKRVFNSFTFIN